MKQRHLVVTDNEPGSIVGIDLADTLHSIAIHFGGAQRADAARAQHAHPAGQGREDLLVPHRHSLMEVSVDDADDISLRQWQAEQIAGGDRRQEPDGVPIDEITDVRQSRPGEQVPHMSSQLCRGSNRIPGQTTCTTGTPGSGRVWST